MKLSTASVTALWPGTAEHTRRYRRRIITDARARRRQLLTLDDIALGGNWILLTRLRHYLNQLSAIHVWEDTIMMCGALILMPAIGFFLLANYATIKTYFPDHSSSAPDRPWTFAAFMAFLGVLWLLFAMAFCMFAARRQRKHEYLALVEVWGMLLVMLLLIAVVALLPRQVESATPNESLPEAVAFALLLFSLVGPLIILSVTLALLFRRRRNVLCPDAVVADNLLRALAVLKSADAWRDLAKRRELLKPIESAATCVETGLPRRLRCGDPITDLWLKQRATHIATALRELKQWIAMPKEDTRLLLMERVKADLVSIAMGAWDQLPGANPQKLSMRVRVAVKVRDAIVALLPFGALFVLSKWLPTIWQPPTLTWLFAGCFVWAVWRLLAILDPGLSTDGFRFVFDLLPSWLKPR